MADANELVAAMKKAATEAVEAGKPVNIYFGKVKAVRPLRIDVEQKMSLGEKQLILARNVTDYKATITGEAGKTEITVHNALTVGDEVILIRQQEGQKFVLVDRIGGAG